MDSNVDNAEKVIGFIAQEVQRVLPEVVHEDEESGILSVAYTEIFPVLIEAFNEFVAKCKTEEERTNWTLQVLKGDVAALAAELRSKMDDTKSLKTAVISQTIVNKYTSAPPDPMDEAKRKMEHLELKGYLFSDIDSEWLRQFLSVVNYVYKISFFGTLFFTLALFTALTPFVGVAAGILEASYIALLGPIIRPLGKILRDLLRTDHRRARGEVRYINHDYTVQNNHPGTRPKVE